VLAVAATIKNIQSRMETKQMFFSKSDKKTQPIVFYFNRKCSELKETAYLLQSNGRNLAIVEVKVFEIGIKQNIKT
jgi:hypothetical protein